MPMPAAEWTGCVGSNISQVTWQLTRSLTLLVHLVASLAPDD